MVRKRSSKIRRQRSTNRVPRLPSCKTEVQALLLFNKIQWHVSQNIEDAILDGEKAEFHPEWLDIAWCRGGMKLLLPTSKGEEGSTSLQVYYQQNIRKATVRFGDILYCIYKFYNLDHVIPEDLTYISVSETMRKFVETSLSSLSNNPHLLRNMRFINFVTPQTRFGGLVHQGSDVYSLRIV